MHLTEVTCTFSSVYKVIGSLIELHSYSSYLIIFTVATMVFLMVGISDIKLHIIFNSMTFLLSGKLFKKLLVRKIHTGNICHLCTSAK